MLKNYTDQHGDTVEVDSSFGQGRVFIHSVSSSMPCLLSPEQVKELIEQLQEALDNPAEIN